MIQAYYNEKSPLVIEANESEKFLRDCDGVWHYCVTGLDTIIPLTDIEIAKLVLQIKTGVFTEEYICGQKRPYDRRYRHTLSSMIQ